MENIRLRPMATSRDFTALVDIILDGWYTSPVDKFTDKGERFYDEAEAIMKLFVQNLLEHKQ